MSEKTIIPKGYRSALNILETEEAIKLIKDTFERELADTLNLTRVSAPLFVLPQSGLNDDLNGVERPVQFDIPGIGGDVQIVHSLAKWKRLALHRYGIRQGSGLYTDMNAIRRDEDLDNLHSVYVDQWDWEAVIAQDNRNPEFLKETVRKIIGALNNTSEALCAAFPKVKRFLTSHVTFITAQDLEDLYPGLSPEEREDEFTRKHGTVFIMQIGAPLKSGKAHSGRAPDYDDWTLNGDLIVWNPVLNRATELSSMGIRVDAKSLDTQLAAAGCDDRRERPYHKMLLNGELPLTIGGGIGQSRMCMLLLGKAHIGEVHASVWPCDMVAACEKAGIKLL
jgi:aspartate--ammonia ligase